ncbi:MAG TPA: hypothetical protein VFH59_04310 [Frateuria sp.]|uniref:hypothetical protein n=1 Tax=Frateuria sp. TaxID=2211372 RepID=UPI002D7FD3AE|nr:hypothetical protein [Frateuria sp.]HET6804650.1 hypothetical protein [Frateuria sp.]
MPFTLALFATVALAGAPAAHPSRPTQVIPTHFQAGHFFATPETADGQALRLVVDTGGGGAAGLYWLTGASAERLHLKETTCALGEERLSVAKLPAFKPGRGLPPPASPCGRVLLVNPQTKPNAINGDGQLGAGYLQGHVWTFDYPAQRLSLEGSDWRPDPAAHATPLGFPRDAGGHPESGFARITIRVDGQPVDMLLDTGATAHPTAAGRKESATPTVDGYGVTSFIATSMVDRWHSAHPDWRVVERGDDLRPSRPSRIIEVPEIEVAGWRVGPVWFTEQPDRAYHEYMASMMDKPVEGALGANVFRHFAMTIDYPAAMAWFRCEVACEAAP